MMLSNLLNDSPCKGCLDKKNYKLTDNDYITLSDLSEIELASSLIKLSNILNGQYLGNIVAKTIKLRFDLKNGDQGDAPDLEIKNTTQKPIAFKQVRLNRNINRYIFSYVSNDGWDLFFISKNNIIKEIENNKIKESKTHPEAEHSTLTISKKNINYFHNKYKIDFDKLGKIINI